jgi:hypothetical protein
MGTDPMIKRPILVSFDDGHAKTWWLITARTPEEISRKYLNVIVASRRPQWMNTAIFDALLENSIDIDDPPDGRLFRDFNTDPLLSALALSSERKIDKDTFVLVYDYGSGAIWRGMRARSKLEILKKYPRSLDVYSYSELPSWYSPEKYPDLIQIVYDIDDPPDEWLAVFLKDP